MMLVLSTGKRCISVGSIYLVTVMLRMFLLGTLVPVVGLDGMARSIFQPLVGVIDLLGMYYAITKTIGKPEIKVIPKYHSMCAK